MEFFNTHINNKAKMLVNEILDSTFISAGKMAEKFEIELEKKLGIINPISVNSGTSALHLALSVAGIKEKDEVIIPAQTFIATGLAVLMQGATPVFADIQYETGNINPESIENKITEYTKAIIPVHWAGYPCDLDEINQIAKKHNLIVIEDAAHAIGATYKEKAIGSISEFTAFSFQAIKHLTTGDGGVLSCLNIKQAEEARKKRWFGIDRKNSLPSKLGERVYDVNTIGFKYHLNDIAAALGIGNLEDIQNILQRRREIASRYYTELINIPGIKLLNYKNDRQSAYWLFTLLVENRDDFIEALQKNNIPSSVVHLRIDKNSIFGGITPGLSNQEMFNERQISIPVHQALSDEDIELIINTIKKGW